MQSAWVAGNDGGTQEDVFGIQLFFGHVPVPGACCSDGPGACCLPFALEVHSGSHEVVF